MNLYDSDAIMALKELISTSGNWHKEQILEQRRGNESFKTLMTFLYSPYIKTNIKAGKILKYNGTNDTTCWPYVDLAGWLGRLSVSTGTNADVEVAINFARWLTAFISEYPEHSAQEIYELGLKIATQTVKCGVSAKTLNKVYGASFIPTGGCMLGTSIKDVLPKYLYGDFIVTEKFDGQRKCLVKDWNGQVTIYSGRNWMPDTNYPEIIADAATLPCGFVYDGEMLADGDFADNIAQRQATTAICNSKNTNKTGVKLHVFDMIPLEDFKHGTCKKSAKVRKCWAAYVLNDLASISVLGYNSIIAIESCKKRFNFSRNLTHIVPAPVYDVIKLNGDYDKAIEAAQPFWDRKAEGIMLNLSTAPYEIKRSKSLLKVKAVEEYDLRIKGFNYGTPGTKNENVCGALTVRYKNNMVGVGSGLSDALRKDIAENFDEKYYNRICTVKTFGESINAENGLASLNAPIFVGMRYDKEEADFEGGEN